MEIIRTNINDPSLAPRRRYYPAEFKASVVQQAHGPAASVAGVALQHGINPVTVHRWIREARQFGAVHAAAFVPLNLEPRSGLTESAGGGKQTIRIDLGQHDTGLSLHWPLSASHELTLWLRDWLR